MPLPEAGQLNAAGIAVSPELQTALQAYLRDHVCEDAFRMTDPRFERVAPMRLLGLNFGHWAIDDRKDQVRDLSLGDDRYRIRRSCARLAAQRRHESSALLRCPPPAPPRTS